MKSVHEITFMALSHTRLKLHPFEIKTDANISEITPTDGVYFNFREKKAF